MIGYIILGIVALFLAVVLIRTALFKPKPQPQVSQEPIEFDREAAINALAELLKCKTISYDDHSLEDAVEFDKIFAIMHDLYPRVFDVCSVRELPDRAILFRWPGKSDPL